MGFFDRFRASTRTEAAAPVPEEHAIATAQQHQQIEAARHSFDHEMMALEIDAAIESHDEWCEQLDSLLKGADAGDWTPGEVRREDRCGLGHWIEGVSDGPLGKSGAFIDLRDLHARFHETAARIVSLHLDGDTPQARQLMTGNLHKLNNRIQQRLDDMKAV